MQIVTRAPTRIDFGGGWTDVPPYPERDGGFVCNIAIDRYATATLETESKASGDVETSASTAPDDSEMLRAIRRHWQRSDVSVAIDNDFPVGAGLGGSSSALASANLAFMELCSRPVDRAALAELGRRVEVEGMGISGGRQDHYAAAFGGALALSFGTRVDVDPIRMSNEFQAELVARSVLVYTGQSRISGETIDAVLGAYRAGEKRVTGTLRRMEQNARQIAAAMRSADVDSMGELLNEQWENQRSLHPRITTEAIDAIIAAGSNAGALGAKALGASGGGCVYLIAGRDSVESVRHAVATLGELLSFNVSPAGAEIVRRA